MLIAPKKYKFMDKMETQSTKLQNAHLFAQNTNLSAQNL